MNELFRRFSTAISASMGSPWAFVLAFFVIIVWGFSGPLFQFSDTWQLVINTSTTIVTFLMVFLIQNTQNRDSRALHLKLDELIIAMKGARNKLVIAEEMNDEDLKKLHVQFERMQRKHHGIKKSVKKALRTKKKYNADL